MEFLQIVFWILTTALCLFFISGHLLNLTKIQHWYVRGWDFPRPQVTIFVLMTASLHCIAAWPLGWFDLVLLLGLTWQFVYQIARIIPFTFLWKAQVKRAAHHDSDRSLRLLICNVERENECYQDVIDVVERVKPDLALFVEVDEVWAGKLDQLNFPSKLTQSQENHYGMMFLSQLEIESSEYRFVVQEDVPSLKAIIKLKNGQRVLFYGLHPRPPEPINDQDAIPRDAELLQVGKEIGDREDKELPVIVAGDLNDVAWSESNDLFLKISELLDPRVGRGRYSSWNAKSLVWRFPLDHIFHSEHFELIEMRVLNYVGSDHFPVIIDLHYNPQARQEQEKPKADSEDEKEADEKIENGKKA